MTDNPYSCFYCNDPATTLDHFIPRALYRPRDGAARFSLPPGAAQRSPPKVLNKVPACEPCNKRKGNMDPRDWLKLCPRAGVARVQERLKELERYLPPRAPLPSGTPLPMPPPEWSRWVVGKPAGTAKSLREYAEQRKDK